MSLSQIQLIEVRKNGKICAYFSAIQLSALKVLKMSKNSLLMNRPQLILTSLILNWTTSITERLNIATLLCWWIFWCSVQWCKNLYLIQVTLRPTTRRVQLTYAAWCLMLTHSHIWHYTATYANRSRWPGSIVRVHLIRCLLETKLRVRVRLRLV